MRQLKCLAEQAQSPVSEDNEAGRLASAPLGNVFSAASPQSLVAVWSNWMIVIRHGEGLPGWS
jgi:hypothetical protein